MESSECFWSSSSFLDSLSAPVSLCFGPQTRKQTRRWNDFRNCYPKKPCCVKRPLFFSFQLWARDLCLCRARRTDTVGTWSHMSFSMLSGTTSVLRWAKPRNPLQILYLLCKANVFFGGVGGGGKNWKERSDNRLSQALRIQIAEFSIAFHSSVS